MHREPDVGFDPGSPGSCPGPKAGAKPLRHPGIPIFKLLNLILSFYIRILALFLFFLRFYLFERERERRRHTGRGRSRLPVGSLMCDLILGPQDHALSPRQTLNH